MSDYDEPAPPKRYPCPECGGLTMHWGSCPNDDSPVPDDDPLNFGEALEAGLHTIFDEQDIDSEEESTADIVLPPEIGGES